MTHRVLVACIGNIFLGDDGFGSAVARCLSERETPAAAHVVDYGIRGMHLAYELMEGGYRALVLVDALPGEEEAGCLRLLRVGREDLRTDGGIDAHSMSPTAVLAFLDALGGALPPTFVVGCQPATLDVGIGLSPPVSSAVRQAAEIVLAVLADELDLPSTTSSSPNREESHPQKSKGA